MKKERLVWIAILVVVVAVQFYGSIVGSAEKNSGNLGKVLGNYKTTIVNLVSSSSEDDYEDDMYYELMHEAMEYIRTHYVDDANISRKSLIYGAISGMLQSLGDDYSTFLSDKDFKELNESLSNQFGGLGIYIGLRDKYPTVIAPIEGTPAYNMGVQSLDKIVEIEGKSSRGMKLVEAIKLLKGKPGTKVSIKIAREEALDLIPMTITRAIINVPTVKYGFIKKRLGYVRIISFGKQTIGKLKEAIGVLNKGSMDKLIIDLRNNPGGFLKGAIAASDMFMDEGKIVATKGRNKQNNSVFYAKQENTLIKKSVPIIVLVNQGSASASEIVAGSLQDSNRAILIGTKTFGKASVQNIIPLKNSDNKAAIRLTVQQYFTPSGKEIHKKGITPDFVVAVPKKTFEELYMEDKINKGKYIKSFVKAKYTKASYSKRNFNKLKRILRKHDIVIKEDRLKQYIRNEKYKKKIRLFDIDYDIQLKKAIEVINKPKVYNKVLVKKIIKK